MRTLWPVVLSVFLSLSGPACATHQAGDDSAPAPQSRVQVENNSSVDMDLYVRRQGASPARLGLAPAAETTTFGLAAALLVGAGLIRFEARPLGKRGEAVVSEPFSAGRGEELHWSIPPQ
jgi:hypothetical protein